MQMFMFIEELSSQDTLSHVLLDNLSISTLGIQQESAKLISDSGSIASKRKKSK